MFGNDDDNDKDDLYGAGAALEQMMIALTHANAGSRLWIPRDIIIGKLLQRQLPRKSSLSQAICTL